MPTSCERSFRLPAMTYLFHKSCCAFVRVALGLPLARAAPGLPEAATPAPQVVQLSSMDRAVGVVLSAKRFMVRFRSSVVVPYKPDTPVPPPPDIQIHRTSVKEPIRWFAEPTSTALDHYFSSPTEIISISVGVWTLFCDSSARGSPSNARCMKKLHCCSRSRSGSSMRALCRTRAAAAACRSSRP